MQFHRKNQYLALFSALLLVLVAAFSVVTLIEQYRVNETQLLDRRFAVERLENSARLLANRTKNDAEEISNSPFLTATNASLASAEIQSLISARLAKVGVELKSSDVQLSGGDENAIKEVNPVGISLEMTASEKILPTLLPLLESGVPIMTIHKLSIRKEERNRRRRNADKKQEWPNLTLSVSLTGYWREE